MKLRRSMNDRMLAGVCSGMARELGLKAANVRWAFILMVLLAGLSLWVYAIAWLLIPSDEGGFRL